MWPVFLIAMVGGFCGLSLVSRRDLPTIAATAALALTLAALGVAILH
jgi:hypothetical protein